MLLGAHLFWCIFILYGKVNGTQTVILKMAAFWEVDFGRLLVCSSAGLMLPESIEKPFVSIYSRLGPFFS